MRIIEALRSFLNANAGRPWLLLIPLLPLLAVQAPSLLAAGSNNLASKALLPEWEAVRQAPGFPRCEPRLGASAAQPYLADALQWDPDSPRALLNEGRAAWLEGDCAAAQASWQTALQAEPDDEIAALWLFWASGGDPEDLPAPIRREALAEYAYEIGRRTRSKDGSTALAWFRFALDLNPDRAMGTRVTHFYRNNKETARGLWQQLAVALPEYEPNHWWALAQVAELKADWAQAAWAYRQGVEVAADAYDFWMAYAAALEHLERWAEAEAAYGQAVVARPDAPEPYLELGHLRAREGDYEGALAWYAEAQSRPDRAVSHHRLAQELYRLGDTEEAITFLDRAIALDGGKPWQWALLLGDWRLQLGDHEGALAAYRQALLWEPGDKEIETRIRQVMEGENR